MRHASGIVVGLCVLALATPAVAGESELAGRVTKLEQALNNRGLLDLLREVERLKQDVKKLRGQLENQTYELEQLRKSQASVYSNLDGRIQNLEGGQVAAPTTGDAPLPMLAPAPGDAVAGTPAPQSALQTEMEAVPGGMQEPQRYGPGPESMPDDAEVPSAPDATEAAALAAAAYSANKEVKLIII